MEVPIFNIDIIRFTETGTIAARCTGENAQAVLLVLQISENQEELHSFLSKVLSAAQLNLVQDVLIVSLQPAEEFSFINLCQMFDIQTIISFGVKLERMGIHFQVKPYHILQYQERNFILADDLQAIYEERQQGGKRMSGELWTVLKTLFVK